MRLPMPADLRTQRDRGWRVRRQRLRQRVRHRGRTPSLSFIVTSTCGSFDASSPATSTQTGVQWPTLNRPSKPTRQSAICGAAILSRPPSRIRRHNPPAATTHPEIVPADPEPVSHRSKAASWLPRVVARADKLPAAGAARAIFPLHRLRQIDARHVGDRRQPGQHVGKFGRLLLVRAFAQARRPIRRPPPSAT